MFRARQELLTRFFPTADNLDRALELARGNDQLFKGIEMVAHEFRNALTHFGIESVPTIGHTFDPAIHEALTSETREGLEGPIVASVYQRGYRHAGRVLRPARVAVADA